MHLIHHPAEIGDGGTLEIVLDESATEGDGTEWVDLLPNLQALVFIPPDPATMGNFVQDEQKYRDHFTIVCRLRITNCQRYVKGAEISTLIDTARQLVELRQRVWRLAQEAKRDHKTANIVTLCDQLLAAVKTPERRRFEERTARGSAKGCYGTAIVPGLNDELRLVRDEEADNR